MIYFYHEYQKAMIIYYMGIIWCNCHLGVCPTTMVLHVHPQKRSLGQDHFKNGPRPLGYIYIYNCTKKYGIAGKALMLARSSKVDIS